MITKGISTGNRLIAEMTDISRVLNMSALHMLIHVVLVLALIATVRAAPYSRIFQHFRANHQVEL